MPLIEPEFMELTKDLDLSGFWEENSTCKRFTTDKPRCAVSFAPDDHWIFGFESVPSTLRYYQDRVYRNDLHRKVNEATREFVGITYFSEDTWENEPKRIENLFRCEFTYQEGGTPWLEPSTRDKDEFAAILDEAESTTMSEWALPQPYRDEWAAREKAGKELP